MAATTFKWSGKNRQGMIQSGEMEAARQEDVVAHLRSQGIMVMTVKEQKKGAAIKIPGLGGGGSASDKDIVIFTRQFATMIEAGLPLVQCLEILSQQTENKALAKCIAQVRQDVESGSTYAEALKKHPKMFNQLYCNMIAAGEAGGILDTILKRLSAYIEKAMKLKKQVKSAMVYPSIIVTVAVLVVSILMVFVIPMFAQMFIDFGGTLPWPTQVVIGISKFMRSNILLIIAAVVAIVFAIKAYYKTEGGRKVIDKIALEMPVIGVLVRKASVAKFTRTLGTLIQSGVPILDALDIVAKTAGNKIVEDAIFQTRASISEGKTLAEPLQKSKVFPPMVTQMIAVGESTGALDAMLGKIADFYDDEVDSAVANLTAMLEPMLMVFLGIVVGFVVIAMYLPIFQMGMMIG